MSNGIHSKVFSTLHDGDSTCCYMVYLQLASYNGRFLVILGIEKTNNPIMQTVAKLRLNQI